MSSGAAIGRIGILWRGDTTKPPPPREENRLRGVFDALEARQIVGEPVVYSDEAADQVYKQLIDLDGVLVWVDPIVRGQDRSRLDAILRDVVSQGVWVSAHPDIIMTMGTKEVLHRTRDLGWGTDTHLYHTPDELTEGLFRLLPSGPRVVKQHRGNGGNGTWKVELIRSASPINEIAVRVLHALRGSVIEEMRLGDFVQRCQPYFDNSGCLIDQPFMERLGDGMIRCYLVQDRVAGFGFQFVKALLAPPPGVNPEDVEVPPRLYYGPQKPEFQVIKAILESEWIPQMQRLLDIDTESLPAIWDADFLYGLKTATGEDTYVLCEVNVQSVYPFPEEALEPLAQAAMERMVVAKSIRQR
ncbi:MAG: Cj0069 family protein [Dehalococcoidales bacterium]|nr:MAG: Cj0069 family protein [Dehalococcoidales bacterium]